MSRQSNEVMAIEANLAADHEYLDLIFGNDPTAADLAAIEAEERQEVQKALIMVDMPFKAPKAGSMDQLAQVLTGEVKPVDNLAVSNCLDELRFAVTTYVQTPDGSIDGQDWWNAFCKQLRARGFDLLGAGYFSAVFSHSDCPDLAFKVGFKKEDSGAAYAAFCRNYQSNAKAGRCGYSKAIAKHLPEILHIERQEKCYMVVMPQYETLERHMVAADSIARDASRSNLCYAVMSEVYRFVGSAPLSLLSSILNGWGDNWESSPEVMQRLHETLLNVYNSNLDYVTEAFGVLADYRSLVLNRNTVEAVDIIHEFFSGVASFDLHGDNAMVDTRNGIKTLVITDPVSFSQL